MWLYIFTLLYIDPYTWEASPTSPPTTTTATLTSSTSFTTRSTFNTTTTTQTNSSTTKKSTTTTTTISTTTPTPTKTTTTTTATTKPTTTPTPTTTTTTTKATSTTTSAPTTSRPTTTETLAISTTNATATTSDTTNTTYTPYQKKKTNSDDSIAFSPLIIGIIVAATLINLLLILICHKQRNRTKKRIEEEGNATNRGAITQNIFTNDYEPINETRFCQNMSQPVNRIYEKIDETLFNVQQEQNKMDSSNYQSLNFEEIEQGREYASLPKDFMKMKGNNAEQTKPNQRINNDYENMY